MIDKARSDRYPQMPKSNADKEPRTMVIEKVTADALRPGNVVTTAADASDESAQAVILSISGTKNRTMIVRFSTVVGLREITTEVGPGVIFNRIVRA